MDYLLGYTSKIDNEISENSILDFHLAHKTNQNFHSNRGRVQVK